MGSSVSFVYAGVKHKMRNLVVFGVAYGLALALAIAISEPTGGTAEEFSDTTGALILILWVVSTVHAFRVNKKYRSNAMASNEVPGVTHTTLPPPMSNDSIESLSGGFFATREELGQKGNPVASAIPVDINSADLQTLLTRLNLSPESAERVLLDRQTGTGFEQVEDFVRSSGLRPHEFAKIRSLVRVVPRERAEPSAIEFENRPGSGRVLDL
jgi:hypothetical protein